MSEVFSNISRLKVLYFRSSGTVKFFSGTAKRRRFLFLTQKLIEKAKPYL